jgi:Na+-transporting NADH:ubiquinone oxidoreductase subunit NqrC
MTSETDSKEKLWGTLARFLTVAWAGNTILVLTFLQLGLLIKYLQH